LPGCRLSSVLRSRYKPLTKGVTMSSEGTRDILLKATASLLVAAIIGGFAFVQKTTTELALLRQEVTQVKSMSAQILSVVEAAHPRQ